MAQKKQKGEQYQYVVPAKDSKGHSERFQFRAIPSLKREVEIILRARAFPYQTEGDLLRHAFVRHMEFLRAVKVIQPNNSKEIETILDILRQDLFQQQYAGIFATLDKVVSNHLSNQALGEARRVVSAVKARIMQMEDDFWRDRNLAELNKRWGYVLDAKGMKLKTGR